VAAAPSRHTLILLSAWISILASFQIGHRMDIAHRETGSGFTICTVAGKAIDRERHPHRNRHHTGVCGI
jgi:hypothetical protein